MELTLEEKVLIVKILSQITIQVSDPTALENIALIQSVLKKLGTKEENKK